MLKKNQIYRATIEGYSSEGLGIAHIDGQVVFVHRAVRGEDCEVLILKVLKNTAFGKVVAVHTLSPHRTEPDCPYYGRCGGCDFRHMDYAEELWTKRQRVQDALRRLGGSDVTVEEILGAERTERYRNKSQYPVAADGSVGFYRSRTHQVTDIDRCLIQMGAADKAAAVLRQYIRQFAVPCYDENTGRGLLRHLYVRSNTRGECLICLLVNGESLPHEPELVELLRRGCPARWVWCWASTPARATPSWGTATAPSGVRTRSPIPCAASNSACRYRHSTRSTTTRRNWRPHRVSVIVSSPQRVR